MNKNIIKVCVGFIYDFLVSLGKIVKVNGKEIVVFKLLSGKIWVIENCCLYKGGVLSEGIVSGDLVFCLMYDWKICLYDGNV